MQRRQGQSSTPQAREKGPADHLWIVLGLGLVLAVAAAGMRTLDFDWVYFDDDINLLHNPLLGGLDASSLGRAFTDLAQMRRYLPLGYTLWNLEISRFGFTPAGFHLTSVLLASAGAFGLFGALRCLARVAGYRGRGPQLAAFAAAALWWLHPMRAESIGWISGQLYLGASLPAFLALWCQLSLLLDGVSTRRRMALQCASFGLYAGSLLVYPVYLALAPLWLLLVFWLHGQRVPQASLASAVRAAVLLAAPWLLAALVVGLVNLWAARHHPGIFVPLADLGDKPVSARLLQALAITASLLGRTVWYDGASPYRGGALDPQAHAVSWLIGGVFLCALLAAGFLRRRRGLLSGSCLAFALLAAVLPVSGVLDSSMGPSDRYSMLPHLVLAALLVLAAGRLRAPKAAVLMLVLAAGVASLWAALQARAFAPWKNTDALQATIDARMAGNRSPASQNGILVLVYGRPAIEFFNQGLVEAGLARIEAGLMLYPDSGYLLGIRGEFESLMGRDPGLVATRGRHSIHMLMHLQLASDWESRGNLTMAGRHRERARALGLWLDQRIAVGSSPH